MPQVYQKKFRAPIRNMSEVERAWLGAMIEAEGSAGLVTTGYNTKGTPRRYPRITVSNSDPEIISAVLRLTGAGGVSTKKSKLSTKLCYQWAVASKPHITQLVSQCSSYTPKLQKLQEII